MEPVVGIFASRDDASAAVRSLTKEGFDQERVQLLMPGASEDELERVPTDDAEQPGVAKAIGAVVGGAAGGAAGLGLGAAAASLLLPGVGPVTAIGLAAAALLGIGGAAGGAAAAGALEEESTHGLPRDEIYLYEDALAHGHSIVFVLARDEDDAERARAALGRAGAESLDAARDRWWIGLRDAEKEHYETFAENFDEVEHSYRRGFASGHYPDFAEASADEALRRTGSSAIAHPDAFRRGFERGRDRRFAATEAPVGKS
jgi:hypothetical protein